MARVAQPRLTIFRLSSACPSALFLFWFAPPSASLSLSLSPRPCPLFPLNFGSSMSRIRVCTLRTGALLLLLPVASERGRVNRSRAYALMEIISRLVMILCFPMIDQVCQRWRCRSDDCVVGEKSLSGPKETNYSQCSSGELRGELRYRESRHRNAAEPRIFRNASLPPDCSYRFEQSRIHGVLESTAAAGRESYLGGDSREKSTLYVRTKVK